MKGAVASANKAGGSGVLGFAVLQATCRSFPSLCTMLSLQYEQTVIQMSMVDGGHMSDHDSVTESGWVANL
jgi:hypothetical protein